MYKFLPEGLCQKEQTNHGTFLLYGIYTTLIIAVVPQVTLFLIPSGKAFRTHNMSPYSYFIHGKVGWFFRLWFWFDLQ